MLFEMKQASRGLSAIAARLAYLFLNYAVIVIIFLLHRYDILMVRVKFSM